MTPSAGSDRFCSRCSISVHDLTDPSTPDRAAPGERRCIRYLYDARGAVVRGPLPADALVVPARALLTKKKRERWLAIAAVASLPILLEACGDEAVTGTDAGADADADAGPDARPRADAAVGRDAAADASND